jgi:pilin isopeptide linkage protein
MTTYSIGITNTFEEDTNPKPLDVTMTYSGTFDLHNGSFSNHEYPETIEIYYDGVSCGTASLRSDSGTYSRPYAFKVSIPFHFNGTSRSEYIPFGCDHSIFYVFTVGSNTYELNYGNDMRSGNYYVDKAVMYDYEPNLEYQEYNNLYHIKEASFSESSSSGIRYDFVVECDYQVNIQGDSRDGLSDYVAQFTITNSANPKGALELTATKTVNGGTPDQAYTFQVLDEDGNVLRTAQNSSDGTISFDPINYDESNIGNEYTYQVKELSGSDEGTTYDDSVYDVTVTPVQDPDDVSKIVASPTITKDGQEVSSIAFDNTVEEEQEAAVTPAQTTTTATPEPTPATGDPSGSLPWLAATVAAAAGVFLGLRKRAQE